MSDSDLALIPEFEPATREAWLGLVAKVLKGADFEKRLVARTADGLALQPLYTRSDRVEGAGATGRTAYFPGGWDIRQRHAEPDPKAANAAILEDLEGGATSLLLQITAPGQAGLSYAAEPLGVALKGVFLDGCAVALDARENTMDAAGSLIEIWRERGDRREPAARRLQLRSARRAGPHRHALLPGPALLRDRRQVRQRLPRP